MRGSNMAARVNKISAAQYMNQLRAKFESLPYEIPLYHFVQRGMDDVFSKANRQIVCAFQQLTDKISFREYYLDHEFAKKWQVDRSPTLLIAPDRYHIRWLGAPIIGDEVRIFLKTLVLVGIGNGQLSDQAVKVMKRLDSPRKVRVFVSSTCPYCPQEALNAVRSAIQRPDLVSLELVDIQSNPDLGRRYSARSVPQTFANDVLIGQGARPEEAFVLSLQKLKTVHVSIRSTMTDYPN
jgi:thioredoxin reductase (NADPH)